MPDRLRQLIVVSIAALAAGCAGIPQGGGVHVGRPVPAPGVAGEVDVRVLPAAAQPGLSPAGTVRGFLRAAVNADSNYNIARSYLTRRAAAGWHAGDAVTTYDDSGADISTTTDGTTTRTLQLRAPRTGIIDARGDFSPRGGELRTSFRLIKQDGDWRIDGLASGVLLSTFDAQRAYRPALVYYVNRSGTSLVPEQVLIRLTSGIATALAHALVAGPGAWLAPSVRTGFPAGTELLGNVPIDPDGVAEVNLSEAVRQASPTQLKALSAQVVWTLRQVSEISAVHLLADGSPLAVPGAPLNQPRSWWRAFNPDAPPLPATAVYGQGGTWRPVGGRLPGLTATARGLTGLAVSHDAAKVAGVRLHRHGASLVVGSRGHAPKVRLTADTLTAPTFDPSSDVYTVATHGPRREIQVVSPRGAVRRVNTDRRLLDHEVQQLRLSRDGARVAAVVGRRGHGRLLVGRVTLVRGVTQFEAFRDVLPDAGDVRGVSWDGGDELVVTAADPGGGRELLEVDVDGYGTQAISTSSLLAPPVDLAKAPGQPLLVEAGGSVWRSSAFGGWSRVGSGSQPVYPD